MKTQQTRTEIRDIAYTVGRQRLKLLVAINAPAVVETPPCQQVRPSEEPKTTVIVEGQLTYSNGVSSLVVANERSASRRHPTHSTLERLGGRQQADVLPDNRRFQSERATNVFGKYDDGFRGHPQCQKPTLAAERPLPAIRIEEYKSVWPDRIGKAPRGSIDATASR